MNRFLCCFKGRGSSQVNQKPPVPQPPQPPEPPQALEPSDPSEQAHSSESIISVLPLGDNEFVNTDDLYSPDMSPDFSMSPPSLSSSGELFRWQEILEGTNNLFITHFLGQGKYGEVYRCHFPRINKVGAVKILDPEKPYNNRQFEAEFKMLHSANHPNVIKLLGKCTESEHQAIVYEFLPKGSLDCHLFAHARPGPGIQQEPLRLDWDTRMRIAVGVAEALIYLHKELKIIHGCVKASNVLLDECYAPKLIDFGYANEVAVDENGYEQRSAIMQAMNLMESLEFIAPETEISGLITTKCDVYSYGVFLFTLFTGREAYDPERPRGTNKITDWLSPIWSSEEYIPLVVDVALGDRFSVEGIIRLFQVARFCIHPNAYERPDMDFVASMVREAAAYPVPELSPITKTWSI